MNRNDEIKEHILVCISPSPSNQKVIESAVKMAEAFGASLTAIYVKPVDFDNLSDKSKLRLQKNIKFAEQNGASVITVTGDDVPFQISEYAHISDTTKIIIGSSGTERRHRWNRVLLTDQLLMNAPDVDVYIIPDSSADAKHYRRRRRLTERMRPTLHDALVMVLFLVLATSIGWIFRMYGFSDANIITVFILAVLIISALTANYMFSIIGSLAGVLMYNWFFVDPIFSFHIYEMEHAMTFCIMLFSSLVTGRLANRMKLNTRNAAREAFRTRVLLDTNQLLQKAKNADDVISITARQIIKLLDRDVIFYSRTEQGNLGGSVEFASSHTHENVSASDENEREIAGWVLENLQAAGFQTEKFGTAKAQYYPICLNDHCYGVIAVCLNGTPMETFENSVYIATLGECALALENMRNAEEKEQASVLARNEQLRANLLRSISHDIRTPLTSISGNASNLLSHYKQLDDETREHIFSDIYDDSEWLVDLVENLLSISRIENGKMALHMATEIMGDIIEEAIRHVDKNVSSHKLTVRLDDDVLLVRVDSRLMVQVLDNIINNAVKYTPNGSEICVESARKDNNVVISVSDNGHGIPDEMKPRIFEMFYTGQNKVADGRRGLGLGLALCKSIVEAHGGTIALSDNVPSGCRFEITLPVEEVEINE